MSKETKTDKIFQEGFEEGIKENQDLTAHEFARLCYLLSEDYSIDHNDAGLLIYKLHHKIKLENLKVDKE